jgi:predicted Zn-dependent protease
MAQLLGKMQQEARLQAELRGDPEAADRFSLLQTHPRTVDRVHEAREAAGVAPVDDPIIGRDVYLSKLEGVTMEDSANQGFVRGRRFLHPKLGFAFEVPEEFRLFNASTQVVAMGPENALIVFDTAGRDATGDPLRYLREQWARGARLNAVERLEIDGMQAATGRTRINTQQGQRDARLVAIRYDAATMYRFMFLTPPNLTAQLSEPLRRTTHSFRRLSEQEAAALEPYRLTIHEVRAGESVADLAARLPYADLRERRFRVLNGLEPGEEVRPGQKVKLVTGG